MNDDNYHSLAVPILAAFKIFGSHIEPMEPLVEFIS